MACNKEHTEVVKLLLNHSDPSIEFNARNELGDTAFLWACREGHTEVV